MVCRQLNLPILGEFSIDDVCDVPERTEPSDKLVFSFIHTVNDKAHSHVYSDQNWHVASQFEPRSSAV